MDAIKHGLPRSRRQRGVGETRPDVSWKVHLEECVGDFRIRKGVAGVVGVDGSGGGLGEVRGPDAVHLEAVKEQVQCVLMVWRWNGVQYCAPCRHSWHVLAEMSAHPV